MFRRAAPSSPPPVPLGSPVPSRRERRDHSLRDRRNHGLRGVANSLARRDPRRFARGMAKLERLPVAAAPAMSSDLGFFLHSFAAMFLFVTIFIG